MYAASIYNSVIAQYLTLILQLPDQSTQFPTPPIAQPPTSYISDAPAATDPGQPVTQTAS